MSRRAVLFSAAIVMAAILFPDGTDASSGDFIQLQAAIGVSTVATEGRYTVSQIVEVAKRGGINVVITEDAFLNRWQYGLWPLRNIIKNTKETGSICRYGIRRYLKELALARLENPGMIILGGLETAPFYYWTGNPFRPGFAIKDWHKHLLVIGLEDPKDYRGLPVLGNGTSTAKPIGLKSILYMIASFLALCAGIVCAYKGRFARKDVYERKQGLLLTQWRRFGIILIAAGAILVANGYPFRGFIYDQYHGDRGAVPYQKLIDYVNSRAGIVFWAHPETKNIEKIGPVSIKTGEHTDLLLLTRDYTGFAVFHEGYNIVGRPGGIWDRALREYCGDSRRSPVWAIGAIGYEKGGDLGESMNNLRTVLLVRKMSAEEALGALKRGRMYVASGTNASRFRLDAFTVGDSSARAEATMGQEIALTGAPRVRIRGHFTGAGASAAAVKILLIRDGEALAVFEKEASFDITYDDESAEKNGRHYYRIELRSNGLVLVTNPVFVTRK